MPSLLINKRQKITTVTRLAGKQLKVMAVWNTLKYSHSLIEHPEIFSDMEWLNKNSCSWSPFLYFLVKFCKEFETLEIAG